MTTLKKFEGREVAAATIKVTNAGDGLSQALAIEPTEYREGETVYVLLETEVSRVAYEAIKDVDALRRVHTLKATTGTIVTEEFAGDAIEAQKRANEEAEGILRLDGSDDDDPDSED